LKSESFLNPFNLKGESREDFVWEIKGNSIQNSAWIGAVKKTEVTLIQNNMVIVGKILEMWVMTIRKAI